MAKTKTTVEVDSNLLQQFKALAAANHGGSRALSSEFEEAMRAFSPQEIIRLIASRLSLKIDRYPSLDDIARDRPSLGTSAGETVREMRNHRVNSLPG